MPWLLRVEQRAGILGVDGVVGGVGELMQPKVFVVIGVEDVLIWSTGCLLAL